MKTAFLFLLLSGFTNLVFCQPNTWGEQFSETIINRYQPTINTMTDKGWDHSNSIILHGMEKIYQQTNNDTYLAYIKSFVDTHVDDQGNITGLKTELDGIHPGILCLFLYEVTNEEKYKVAATNMRNYLLGTESSPSVFQQTPNGGYWHKNNDHYENVMTVDGVYMSNPFLVKYGVMFNDQKSIDAATFQTLLVAAHTFNIDSKLPYHGWDYHKTKSWAHPVTGTSSEVWSRSIGWFSMALADILENLPADHKDFDAIRYLYQQLAEGIIHNQDPEHGVWYQMIAHQELDGNYPETSGTGMIIYALKKGVNEGWLDDSYNPHLDLAWSGMQKYISTHKDGMPQINSFNPGMGIKDNIQEYLKVRPVSCPSEDVKQHPHGYCAVLMAASVMEY